MTGVLLPPGPADPTEAIVSGQLVSRCSLAQISLQHRGRLGFPLYTPVVSLVEDDLR
jgi:hypothetical protein